MFALLVAGLSSHIFAVGVSDVGARSNESVCGPGSIGLINSASGQWIKSTCMSVDFADDVLTSTTLDSGEVLVYVTPITFDSFLARIDFATRRIAKFIVGGSQGDLRCLPDGSVCYGVTPGDGSTPTQLIAVNATTGDSRAAMALRDYDGYSIDGSALDPTNLRFHAVLVGKPHSHRGADAEAAEWQRAPRHNCGRRPRGCPVEHPGREAASNQWLVTVDLVRLAVTHEVPVSGYLMGPFSVSTRYGLATFGSDAYDGLTSVDFTDGAQVPLVEGGFGTIMQYSAAFSSTSAFAVNVYPQPARFFAIDLAAAATPAVTTNATAASGAHALCASFEGRAGASFV